MATEKPRLFEKHESYSSIELTSRLYQMAVYVEDVLLEAGAKPDIDYTYIDVMRFAVKIYSVTIL